MRFTLIEQLHRLLRIVQDGRLHRVPEREHIDTVTIRDLNISVNQAAFPVIVKPPGTRQLGSKTKIFQSGTLPSLRREVAGWKA
jgi:hypothetical protein